MSYIMKEGNNMSELNEITNQIIHMVGEKGDLINDISHELGSPLSRMVVAADIIKIDVEAGNVPSPEIVDKLSKNIKEMSRIINGILALSRHDKVAAELFNPEYTVKRKILELNKEIEEKNIKIEVYTEDNLENVSSDKEKIGIVINELLKNAIYYSPANSSIQIILKRTNKFSFTIKDEGPGIKEENKDKIFAPFFREESSRNRKTGGAGLGLSISKKLIELHGGKIFIENPGQKGLIVTFEI